MNYVNIARFYIKGGNMEEIKKEGRLKIDGEEFVVNKDNYLNLFKDSIKKAEVNIGTIVTLYPTEEFNNYVAIQTCYDDEYGEMYVQIVTREKTKFGIRKNYGKDSVTYNEVVNYFLDFFNGKEIDFDGWYILGHEKIQKTIKRFFITIAFIIFTVFLIVFIDQIWQTIFGSEAPEIVTKVAKTFLVPLIISCFSLSVKVKNEKNDVDGAIQYKGKKKRK